MKKFIFLVMILALTLTACGGEDAAESKKVANDSNDITTTDVENNEESTKEEKDKKKDKKAVSDSYELFSSNATIEETIIIDEKDIKVTATGLEYDRNGAHIKLLIENNSSMDIELRSGTMSSDFNEINHYNVAEGYLNCSVSAGMKSNETIKFSSSTLKAYGIHDIAEIKLGIRVEDTDNNEIIDPVLVSIPTSIYEDYDFEKDTFIEAVNEGIYEDEFGASIDYKEDINKEEYGIVQKTAILATNSSENRALLLELENVMQESKYVAARNVRINGLVVYESLWTGDEIGAGSRRVLEFDIGNLIDEEFTNIIAMDEIGKIEFELAYYDSSRDNVENVSEVIIETGENVNLVFNDEKVVYEANGITISQIAISQGSLGRIFMPLVIRNNSNKDIHISQDYGTLSVNSFMTNALLTGNSTIKDNTITVMAITLYESDQEECGVKILEDVKNAQITLEIKDKDNYKNVEKPVITISYE